MNKFNFWIPADIKLEKSGTDANGDVYENMILEGMASDNSEDSDGEIMEPGGFDIDSFKKSGLINLEHFPTRKQSPKAWIGEPIDASIKGNKFYIKAKLWGKSQLARDAYDTINAMRDSGSSRKVGWSIEGYPLQRDPHNDKRITKARITNVALTFRPKNANTYADLIKGEQVDDFIQPEYESTIQDGKRFLYEFEKSGTIYRVNEAFKIYKAMVAGNTTGTEVTNQDTHGEALKKESLDEEQKDTQKFKDSLKYIAKCIRKGMFNQKQKNIIHNKLSKMLQ